MSYSISSEQPVSESIASEAAQKKDIFFIFIVFQPPPGIKDAVVMIHSDNGVRNLNVEIISDFLTDDFLGEVGMVTKFDRLAVISSCLTLKSTFMPPLSMVIFPLSSGDGL